MHLLFLPSYLPDFNLIELVFSTIKVWLCKNQNCINKEMKAECGVIYNVFWEAVHLITAEQAKGWYSHCGYKIEVE